MWPCVPLAQSTQAGRYGSSTPSMVIVWPMQAASPNSRASRRTVAAGMVVIVSVCSGVIFGDVLAQQLERRASRLPSRLV